MVKMWLMRGVCLVLLVGVVGVWVGSYGGLLIMSEWSGGRYCGVGAVQGLGYMVEGFERGHPWTPLSLSFGRGWTADTWLPPRTLGFYGSGWPWAPGTWEIVFPLWLPTLLLVMVNWLVWRWTRRRIVGAVGFPIEPRRSPEV